MASFKAKRCFRCSVRWAREATYYRKSGLSFSSLWVYSNDFTWEQLKLIRGSKQVSRVDMLWFLVVIAVAVVVGKWSYDYFEEQADIEVTVINRHTQYYANFRIARSTPYPVFLDLLSKVAGGKVENVTYEVWNDGGRRWLPHIYTLTVHQYPYWLRGSRYKEVVVELARV